MPICKPSISSTSKSAGALCFFRDNFVAKSTFNVPANLLVAPGHIASSIKIPRNSPRKPLKFTN